MFWRGFLVVVILYTDMNIGMKLYAIPIQKVKQIEWTLLVDAYTVGTYSPGKLSVVYEMSMQVFPTVPSPTTTHLMGRPEDILK